MQDVKNVGHADSVIRKILGAACVVLVAYHFLMEAILPLFALIPIIILIPYFLKTGMTQVCPIMKSMNVSTMEKEK